MVRAVISLLNPPDPLSRGSGYCVDPVASVTSVTVSGCDSWGSRELGRHRKLRV